MDTNNIESKEVVETKEIKKPSRNWLLWWSVDDLELKSQVDNYHTLSMFKSAKGQSTLLLLLSSIVTFLFIILGSDFVDSGAYVDIALFLILAFFVYRGHRWAIIAAMIIWTFEKVYFIIEGEGSVVVHIIWWALYMSAFWLAFKVESERKKQKAV